MKKIIQEELYRTYESPTLFLDDLEEILAVLDQYCEGVTVSDRNYTYDDFTEAKDKLQNKTIHSLTISSSEPPLKLVLDEKSFISVNDNDAEAVAAFFEVDAVLQKKVKSGSWKVFVLWCLFLSGIVIGITNAYTSGARGFFFPTTVSAMLAMCWMIVVYVLPTSKATINVYNVIDRPSFFIRKKDELLVNLIVAAFSIVGTIAVQQLFKEPPKNTSATVGIATPAPDETTVHKK